MQYDADADPHTHPPLRSEQKVKPLDYSAIGFLVLDTLCYPATAEMPPAGGAVFVERVRMTPAGTAGGTAMVCGIMGLQGQIVAQVCDDDAGEFLVQKLQSYGVKTDLMMRRERSIEDDVQTSCSMLPIQKNGERAAFFCPGTSSTFTIDLDNGDESYIHSILNAHIIHLGGTGLLPKFDGAPSLRLLRKAKQELNRTVVFDLILATPETAALVEPLLPYIDYFCPSVEEAAVLAGISYEEDHDSDQDQDASTMQQRRRQRRMEAVPKIASYFKAKGVKNAILTMDVDGVYVDPEDGDPFIVPSHDISVVDTTGCGDSFTAGIIVGLVKNWSLQYTVRFANAVAAQVALGLGSDGDRMLLRHKRPGSKGSVIEGTIQFMETTPYRSKEEKVLAT